jgi:pimeloyl-ACP methyl ester carboxylesterase
MPFLERPDGVKINYNDTGGDGPAIFFTHGHASGSKLWDAQVDELRRDFRCITWDMRGHAGSDSPEDPRLYSKQHQVDDMKAVLDHCGVKSAVFLGHSMGAYDNMLFYLSDKRNQQYVDAFIFYGTGPGFSKPEAHAKWNVTGEKTAKKYEEKGLEALVGSDRMKGHRSAIGLVNATRRVLCQWPEDPLFKKFADGPLVAARNLDKLDRRVLLIIGERDKGFTASTNMMEKKLPNSTKVLVEGAGHMACEQQPARFNEAIREFVFSVYAQSKL